MEGTYMSSSRHNQHPGAPLLRYGRTAALLGLGLGVSLALGGCAEGVDVETSTKGSEAPKAREIVSNTDLIGTVNDQAVEGRISAVINPSFGGNSTCEFSALPKGFSPGTFGTHT